ncbi:hypothetical protein BHM03_00062358, partial [Ensete ventricosum]
GLYSHSNGISVPESLIFFIAYHTAASHHVVHGLCGETRLPLNDVDLAHLTCVRLAVRPLTPPCLCQTGFPVSGRPRWRASCLRARGRGSQELNSSTNPRDLTEKVNLGINLGDLTERVNSGTNPVDLAERVNSGTNLEDLAEKVNSGTNPKNLAEKVNYGTNPRDLTEWMNSSTNPGDLAERVNLGTNPRDLAKKINSGINPGDLGKKVNLDINPGDLAERVNSGTNSGDLVEKVNSSTNPEDLAEKVNSDMNPGDLAKKGHLFPGVGGASQGDPEANSSRVSSGPPSPVDARVLRDLEVMKADHDLDTTVTDGSLAVIRGRYNIPVEYGLHAPRPGQRPYSSDAPDMCITVDALEVGLWFPLHPLIEECLRWWRISPS